VPGDDIVFQFDIAADPAAVRSAVAKAGGVGGWWTDRARVADEPGGRAVLEFPGAGPDDFDVVETGPRPFFRHGGFHDEESRAIPAFVWGQLMPLLEGFAETPFFRAAGAGA
jgi:hypothetical protein